MNYRLLTPKDKKEYNKLVDHVIQSWEWGDFRASIGLPLLRYGIFKEDKMVRAFELTLHSIPFSKRFVGYLPKGPFPDAQLAEVLKQVGMDNNCAFIKVEPNVLVDDTQPFSVDPNFVPAIKTYFTKFNYILDLSQSEEELLSQMHPKTRYNIKVAEKKGVEVKECTDEKSFKLFLKLYFDTTKRQGYFGHNEKYHQKAWDTLRENNMARILIGFYEGKPLSAWMLYNFKDTLYYPYGGSSIEQRDVMANNLVAWEAIKLGKRLKLKEFDLWGALPPDAPSNHPWQGFNRFKKNYGAKHVEYLGSYDLIFDQTLYFIFNFFDKNTRIKAAILKLIGK